MISLLTDWQYRRLELAGAWHLAYYIPDQRTIPGTLSHRIIEFKNLNPFSTVDAWCRWTIADLAAQNIGHDYIIRALGSSELTPTARRGLDILGERLAIAQQSVYAPRILGKTRTTPAMHTLKTKEERHKALDNAYQVADRTVDLNGRRVLILDDVTTSKTTLTEILRALRVEWPRGQYSFFCLGKTSREPDANNSIPLSYFT
jgi:hypothetical protein